MAVALCQKVSWKTLACCVLLAGSAPPALAQFKLQESFEGTTAPGWTLSNSAILTAPSIDTAGSGWLRLTPTARTTPNSSGPSLTDLDNRLKQTYSRIGKLESESRIAEEIVREDGRRRVITGTGLLHRV